MKEIIFKGKNEQTFRVNNKEFDFFYNLVFGDLTNLTKDDLKRLLFMLDFRGLIDEYIYDDITNKIEALKC